jgi:nicotinate-nucleotide pyrophosphorylase (carboxylating)
MLHRWHGTVDLIRRALEEDAVISDVTSALLPDNLTSSATMVSRSDGVLAGIDVGLEVFRCVDESLICQALVRDGDPIVKGEYLATIEGMMSSILRGERTALNFVQRMSGIATATSRFVEAVSDLPAIIIDTRKTVPGFRLLDKYSVRMGGAQNHRMNLADGVLIKDNHIAAAALQGEDLASLVQRAHMQVSHTIRVEVECDTIGQVLEALNGGADIILLDNMDINQICEAVVLCKGRAVTEVSGGVTLDTVREIAETGVDLISSGQFTHSVHALDISLDVGGMRVDG